MPVPDIDIDKELEKISKKSKIPKNKLYKVYNKILDRLKHKAPKTPIEVKKRVALFRLRYTIRIGFPVSFCPYCPHYYNNDFRQLQRHLKDKHNWGSKDLDRVRTGFFTARAKKRLDYRPKLP